MHGGEISVANGGNFVCAWPDHDHMLNVPHRSEVDILHHHFGLMFLLARSFKASGEAALHQYIQLCMEVLWRLHPTQKVQQ